MKAIFVAFVFVLVCTAGAKADELISSYVAYIGDEDLYNSEGERLFEPWQILRQDRANFHKFGIFQEGDQDDEFFASASNRALMERMIQRGSIEQAAAQRLAQGHSLVKVKIYGRGTVGRSVTVQVFR